MSTACDNFKPHRWKPRQCAACFKPKAEHSGVNDSTGDESNNNQTVKTKQSPYYKKFSFSKEDEVDQKATSRDKEATRPDQQSTALSTDRATNTAKLRKPHSEDRPEEIKKEQSPSLQAAVDESNCNGSVPNEQRLVNDHVDENSKASSEATSDMSGNTPPRPPPPRARSHTVAVPRVKPRKHIPEPSDLLLSTTIDATTKALPREPQPVPAPRRNRTNRSSSPRPASGSLDDTNVCRAKSLDNLDVSPPNDRKVKFNLETTAVPNANTSSVATKKDTEIQPYAVSEVTTILQKASTKNGEIQDNEIEENDDHEYIEADQLSAAVVSVTELKNKHRPSQVTKYSTLSALQPARQQDKKPAGNGGVKQKAMSSGTITVKNIPRRQAPPPPGVTRNRSATISSVDKIRIQNHSAPRRPPPPVYYTNANIKRPSKVNEAPVNKVPPPKPVRTVSTFDYENLNGITTTEDVEYSVVDSDKEAATSDDPSLPPPKKPVRMPKEATPVSNGVQSSSQQLVIKGRYIDLDIDQLADQRGSREHTPLMKYENFDDFSPRPNSPELKSPEAFDALSAQLPLEGAAQVHDAILNSLNIASAELAIFYFNEFTFMGKTLCSKWSDFDPVGMPSPGTAACVKYNGKLLSLQDFSKERVDGEKATLLPPHPNICRVVALFTDNPPSKLVHKFKVKKGRTVAVTDCVPAATVSEFVKQNFLSMKQLEYDRHVLLILVQLFSAIKHLHQNGTVHRDLSADTCRYDPKSGIMKVTDFTYALHRPPPITSSTFLYGYSELKWLGGTGSKLPPEIINTPDDCQTLDYSMSDIFAAGCLIYELFGMEPPFDKDEQLICKNYTRNDLPHIPKRSQYSNLINQLIYLLLQVDTSKRIKPHTALLLVQAILWGPVSWVHGAVSESAIQSYLAVEKSRLVTSVALNSLKANGKPSVELMLKNIFIQECNPSNLINALSLLNTE